jgi:Peptidase A4 family
MRFFRPAVLVTALMLLGASAAQAHVLRHPPKHKRTATTSTNWSGYTVDGSNATDVLGSWTQPKVQTCASSENTWSSPWVGIDGDVSNTVEQIGTDSDCAYGSPTYYAWYEMYPKSLVMIRKVIKPGDSLTAEVKYVSGGFQMTLVDPTESWSYTTTQSAKKAARSSVEWIMEGPVNSGLTNFGSIGFTSTSGTINGQTGSLGTLSNVQPITMTSNSGATRAVPATVGSDPYGVNWVSH